MAIGVSAGGVPSIYRNVAIVGASSTENPQEGNAIGNPRAFDVVTGKKLWEFQTVPKAGEKFNETWGPDGWQNRQGTNMWGFAAPIDYERGIAYLPISGPAANYYGGDRPGNNVYGNSIVAVDAQTGKYKWHFQTVHHDLWDSDMPSAGALIEVNANGRRSPAIAHVGKTSYFFVLNRENGNPLIKVEERPVPKGDVPTEWYSPTQPFPVKPGPLVPTSFNKDTDMVRPEDTTPEHAAACQATWDREGGFINLGPFTPFMYHELGAPPKSTIQLPGGTGGVNWGGVAADPNGIVYVNAQSGNLAGWVEKVEMVEDPVDETADAEDRQLAGQLRIQAAVQPRLLCATGSRATDSWQRSVPFVHGERHALHPSPMGPADCGQCEHRRDPLEVRARPSLEHAARASSCSATAGAPARR